VDGLEKPFLGDGIDGQAELKEPVGADAGQRELFYKEQEKRYGF